MTTKDKSFLLWLSNRLVHKHGYAINSDIVEKINDMVMRDTFSIKEHDLDLIISKYYPDFLLDKTNNINIGYSNDERKSLRLIVRSLVKDIIEENLPQNIIR